MKCPFSLFTQFITSMMGDRFNTYWRTCLIILTGMLKRRLWEWSEYSLSPPPLSLSLSLSPSLPPSLSPSRLSWTVMCGWACAAILPTPFLFLTLTLLNMAATKYWPRYWLRDWLSFFCFLPRVLSKSFTLVIYFSYLLLNFFSNFYDSRKSINWGRTSGLKQKKTVGVLCIHVCKMLEMHANQFWWTWPLRFWRFCSFSKTAENSLRTMDYSPWGQK